MIEAPDRLAHAFFTLDEMLSDSRLRRLGWPHRRAVSARRDSRRCPPAPASLTYARGAVMEGPAWQRPRSERLLMRAVPRRTATNFLLVFPCEE